MYERDFQTDRLRLALGTNRTQSGKVVSAEPGAVR
jgi:hypothetical protein